MIGSLLIKLGMIALTMGVILWIGWAVPDEGKSQRENFETKGHTILLEQTAPATTAQEAAMPTPAPGRSGRPHTSSKVRSDEPLDLNRASEQDFESLPGIGPVLAGRIVEYRKDVGSFRSVEDLREVKGIGKKKFEQIRNLVRVTGRMQPAREGKRAT